MCKNLMARKAIIINSFGPKQEYTVKSKLVYLGMAKFINEVLRAEGDGCNGLVTSELYMTAPCPDYGFTIYIYGGVSESRKSTLIRRLNEQFSTLLTQKQ